MRTQAMDLFDTATSQWFEQTFGKPTAVQEKAWPAIHSGAHTLVSAPTGTGKTLCAFLVFLDQLNAQARAGTLGRELQLIYVSPLKSLAGDIRENLRRPLEGIARADEAMEIQVCIRTGDTAAAERRRMVKHPPHILITTPESLYLLATSKSGQSILCTARAVIIDELHALIDSKRGAHLMLTIARLDRLCQQPLQRIGFSATIKPLQVAAAYLAPEQVFIAAPEISKEVRIAVCGRLADTGRANKKDPVWQEMASAIVQRCTGSRSVIAFVEGRMYAEKLAYYVNQIGGDGFARTHHGSLSKEQRFETEQALRGGKLRLLCATSSMELGIDVGDIDQVFQIGCPRTISGAMQRLGRAGHNPGRESVMLMFPRSAPESLFCGLTAEAARQGGVEAAHPPRACLDVLAQHLVAMASGEGYTIDQIMSLLPRAYPFRDVTREDVKAVLCMLAGDYEHARDLPVRPRILYDRIHERVEGDSYSRMLAVSSGGTIPDKGLYAVKTEEGVKLGELDEEFIFESRIGDKFLLGTFAWRIVAQNKDAVIVRQAATDGARLPFWKGEIKGRALQTGLAFGGMLRRLGEASEEGVLKAELCRLGLDEEASESAAGFIERQIAATAMLPDDRTILVEHFHDQSGCSQIMIHSLFGRQVNAPLAVLLAQAAKEKMQQNVACLDDDNGLLLYPYGEDQLPDGLLESIAPSTARALAEAVLPVMPVFGMTFRYNAARALMMGVRKRGRQPLWMQRLRSADMLDALLRVDSHPLVRETKRECMEDLWDIAGVEYVLNGIQSGSIMVHEMHRDLPSPMCLPLQWQAEAANMYDYSPTPAGIHQAVGDKLAQLQLIDPAREELDLVSRREHLPEDAQALHTLLMIEGDLVAGELAIPYEWLETLCRCGQAAYIEPGLWIAAEHADAYESALASDDRAERLHLVRRLLRYRGAQSALQVAGRYAWTQEMALDYLTLLCAQQDAVEADGIFYHARLYDQARRQTVKSLRRQIQTLPPEKYAALLVGRIRRNTACEEGLRDTLRLYRDTAYPVPFWESTLLPYRIKNYQGGLLDALLAKGELFWQFTPEKELAFHLVEEIDWEADLTGAAQTLDEEEKIVYEALSRRGASFMSSLTGLLNGVSPHAALLRLAAKGLVCADSFVPVRQWLDMEKDKSGKSTVRQRVNARVIALTAGRWDIARPLAEDTMEKRLDRAFESAILLCRETAAAQNLPWQAALEVLRLWEYTGRVRRGYFFADLSGAQFIRDKEFAGIMQAVERPDTEICWMSAADPAQVWGKVLAHRADRAFLHVAGTAVALRAGSVVAVFERQGKILRVFDASAVLDGLRAFAQDFKYRRIFTALSRVVVKEYPPCASEALAAAGFRQEMQDFVLYG